MKLVLKKRPKNPILIEGFPGFGMVGAIASEYLIQNLNTEQIGSIQVEEAPAMVAVHDAKLIDPFSIHYDKKNNLVIVHAVTMAQGVEWKLGDVIMDVVKQLGVKEIVSLEGLGTNAESSEVFYYSTSPASRKQLDKLKYKPLDEGIILGLTASLLIKHQSTPVTCIFAETHSQMPDSRAAAKLVEAVDSYLGLKVDTKPLLVMADVFEKKLKTIMQQTQIASDQRDRKQMDYVG